MHEVIDGFDFGVPTDLLQSDDELLRAPAEHVDRLVEQRAAWKPAVLPSTGHAIEAQKAEVANTRLSFEFDGETYTIPPSDEWDIEVFEMIESGKLVTASKLMLGPDEWKKFRAKPRTAVQFNDFFLASQETLSTKSE